jgi:hypothetical protein
MPPRREESCADDWPRASDVTRAVVCLIVYLLLVLASMYVPARGRDSVSNALRILCATKFHSLRHIGAAEADYHVDCVLRISTSTAIGPSGRLIGIRIVALRRLRLAYIQRDPLAHRVSWRASTPPRMPLRRLPRLASPTRVSAGVQAARQFDWGAVGPASGSFADWRTAFSNFAIAVVHGPASTDVMLRSNATPTNKTATAGRFMISRDVLIPFC